MRLHEENMGVQKEISRFLSYVSHVNKEIQQDSSNSQQ